ncbi:MAG: DRTGG domain-containing protein [Ignavibacteria bacterium]|jgi:predicted transcriptional regulator
MNLKEIKEILNCRNLSDESLLDTEIDFCIAADLMSDVLRFARTGSLLLTGITNNQVLQVAEIMDLRGIIFVRGKEPDKEIIAQAKERKLPLLITENLLFDACGILFSRGLKGGKTRLQEKNGSTSNIQPVVHD